MKTMHQTILQLLFILLISMIAWFSGQIFPRIGAPILALFLGALLAPAISRNNSPHTYQRFSKHFLFFAVVLLGFSMDFHHVIQTSTSLLWFIIRTVLLGLTAAWLFSRLLNLRGNSAILVGVGTSICGGSAILATASVIHAKEEEIAQSLSTIFLFNFLAAILFPVFGQLLQLSPLQFGTWAGTAINDTSSVLAATYSFNKESVDQGILIKLTRTLMIIPITIVLSLKNRTPQNNGNGLRISVPWPVIGFLATALTRTMLHEFDPMIWDLTKAISQWFMIMALVAIGFMTHLTAILQNGKRAILLGLLTWIVLSLGALSNIF